MVKPCTIPQPGHWPWYNPWNLFTSVLLIVICLYWCVYFNAQKLPVLFFHWVFSQKGHRTSLCSVSGNGDRYFSHRNQSPPCRVLFPTIAWECSKLSTKSNQWPQKTMMVCMDFLSVFYFSILYVQRAGFSSIFSVPLISTCPPLPICFLFVFNRYSKYTCWKITTQVSKSTLQRVISRLLSKRKLFYSRFWIELILY